MLTKTEHTNHNTTDCRLVDCGTLTSVITEQGLAANANLSDQQKSAERSQRRERRYNSGSGLASGWPATSW